MRNSQIGSLIATLTSAGLGGLLAAAALVAVAAAGAAAVGDGSAAAQESGVLYHFGTHTKHTNIAFVSEAEIETIHGTTNVMSGTFFVDFDELKGKANLVIPVADLRTGIETRDEHLRSDVWLDAASHPDITLTSDDITLTVKNADRGIYAAKLKAKLSVHGVTKERELEATIVRLPAAVTKGLGSGEWVKVSARFDVKLADHDVKIPAPQVAPKVSEVWSVSFSAFATTTAPERR